MDNLFGPAFMFETPSDSSQTSAAPEVKTESQQSETPSAKEASGKFESVTRDGQTPTDAEQKAEGVTKLEEGADSGKPDIKAVNDLIAKAGLTYKSNGKVVKVDNIESLLRVASRAKPIEDSLRDIQAQREQLLPVVELLQQLRSDDDALSEQALLQLLPEARLTKMAEARMRRIYEEEQRGGPLTEREKELQRQLQEQQLIVKKAELAKQQEQERIRQEHEQKQIMAVKTHIAQNVSDALQLMDLPQKLEPLAVEFMKPIMRNLISNGIALTPEILAEKVGPMFEEMLSYKTRNLEGDKLIKFLGDDVGKRFRKALLAQLQQPKTAPSTPAQKAADSKFAQADVVSLFKPIF